MNFIDFSIRVLDHLRQVPSPCPHGVAVNTRPKKPGRGGLGSILCDMCVLDALRAHYPVDSSPKAGTLGRCPEDGRRHYVVIEATRPECLVKGKYGLYVTPWSAFPDLLEQWSEDADDSEMIHLSFRVEQWTPEEYEVFALENELELDK